MGGTQRETACSTLTAHGSVYTKPSKQPPDYSQPVVLREGKCTVEDFANSIHKECVRFH